MKIDITVHMNTSQSATEDHTKAKINKMLSVLKEIEKMSNHECSCSIEINESN